MRNLPAVLLWIFTVYMWTTQGFSWIYPVLLLAGIAITEYPTKEGREVLRAQIEELKARTENIQWNTKLNMTTTKINMETLRLMGLK
jgi:hypothetical protein